jgi:uncharacterized membrane protein YdjX (TVP38/TMEM64 family)
MIVLWATVIGSLLGLVCIYILGQMYVRFRSDGPFVYMLYSLCGITGGSVGFALSTLYYGHIILPLVASYIAMRCLKLILI